MLQQVVLLGPDRVARAAALVVRDRRERWMLCQPRAVRTSFALQALDGDERDQTIWMLRQADAVRESYLREVVEPGSPGPDTLRDQTVWMLRQPQPVRESYLREVLHAPQA